LGTSRSRRSSTASGVLPWAMRVRLETRKMCVSTAMVGSPKAVLSTTLAVLRPTPGRASSALRSRGTSPPCSSTSMRQVCDDVLGLAVEEADGLDVRLESVLAEVQDRLRCVGHREQARRRLVDALVGRLGRQDHGHQQLEGAAVVELRGGLGLAARRRSKISVRLAWFMGLRWWACCFSARRVWLSSVVATLMPMPRG
jgi:hypothetical protein